MGIGENIEAMRQVVYKSRVVTQDSILLGASDVSVCLEVNLQSFIQPKFISGLHRILMMIILCVPPFSKTISLTDD